MAAKKRPLDPAVIRVGDTIRITAGRHVKRVGYPKTVDDYVEDAKRLFHDRIREGMQAHLDERMARAGETRPRYAAGVGDAFTFIEDVEELEQVDLRVAAAQERLISAVQRRGQLRVKLRDALVTSIRATSPEPLDVLRDFQQVLMQARQGGVSVRQILMPPAGEVSHG